MPAARSRRRPIAVPSLLLVSALLASSTVSGTGPGVVGPSSQERAQQPYSADVDLVLIDCVVVDASGRFVHGLKQDDFRLTEEGRAVEVRFFSEQHYGSFEAADAGAEAGAPAGDEVVGLPRYLVIFVDAFNTAPDEWDRLRPALVDYVRATLTGQDRILVAILTPDRRLRVAPEFTAVPEVVEAALSWVQANPEIRERTRQNEQQLVSMLQAEASGAGFGDAAGAAGETTALRTGAALAGFFALERRDEVLHTLDTLISLAEHLDQTQDIAGPKAMLFVSGGLPEQPGSNYYYILDEYASQADPSVRTEPGVGAFNPIVRRTGSNNGVEENILATVGRLNRMNYTVYTIDARGAADFAADSAATALRTPVSPEARTQSFQDAQNGLGTIARTTGGLSFFGTNNFAGAIADIHTDTAYRYVLGYRPPEHDAEDVEKGKFFRVRVEVDVDGVTVRAREGYVEGQ